MVKVNESKKYVYPFKFLTRWWENRYNRFPCITDNNFEQYSFPALFLL